MARSLSGCLMLRIVSLPIAIFSFAILGNAWAADKDNPLKEALALEDATKEAIKSAEPSIACILVTRDKKEYEKVGQGPSADEPGRLGGFQIPSPTDPESVKKSRKLDLSDPDYVPESYGSGIVISAKERLILTNYHVVRDAVKIYVRVSQAGKGGEVIEKGSYANIHAADPRSDLAVLQLLDPKIPLTEIRVGNAKNLEKGQFVVALSYPFAVGFRDGSPSASFGIISNIRRPVLNNLMEVERSKFTLAQYGRLIQVDARLNLGCSGGALVNLKGEMIGITNSLAALSGVETPGGFALPFDDSIRAIVDVLKRGEEVEYGFLGVSMHRDTQRADAYQIESVIPNSPAEKAELRERTYIVSINGVPIHDANELFFNINIITAGSSVKIVVANQLGGDTETKTAILAKSYVVGSVIASQRPDIKKYGGLRVDYTSVLVQSLRERNSPYQGGLPHGVMIREVAPQSPAEQALLQPDKIVAKVNGEAVNAPKDFYAAMDKARKRAKSVELEITNLGRDPYTVKLDLP